MNEEIMLNEEVMDIAEEAVAKGSGKGWKIGLGVAAVAAEGYQLAKKVVKPAIEKHKAKKAAKKAQEEVKYEVYDTEDFKLD